MSPAERQARRTARRHARQGIVARQLTSAEHAALVAGLPRTTDLTARRFERGAWVAGNAAELEWAR